MKKCPTCEKTFEDSMRFCQSDGTQLVAVEEVIDPYKTMVARPEEIAAAIPVQATETPKQEDGEVLQIPKASDPMRTMAASEEEIRREMAMDSKPEEPVMEIPPAAETPAPPAFIDADLNPVSVPPPVARPREPASVPNPEPPIGGVTTPPIPSPFGEPKKTAADVSPMMPQYKEREPKVQAPPSVPSFDEPAPASTPSSPFQAQTPGSPFDTPSASPAFDEPRIVMPSADSRQEQKMAQAEWPPPAAQEPSWQTSGGSGTPPAAGAAGQNKTLAIVSLVIGILSLCCSTFFIPGLAAIVTGFMARGKASKDPAHYTGAGLALGGIICGGLSIVLGIILIIVYIIWGAAIMAGGRGF